ncbi:MAG TPA: glutathione S-transferase [Azonexus sp.]|nr:glutathione S-transferase [Azonexus sp.]
MKLIGSHTSPYTRKVRVVLAEKKKEYEFIVDHPRSPDSSVPDLNPLGRIPTLLLDDDTALFDSRVIVEHIDNITPNNKLLPAPNRERTEVKRWEALADGLCDAAVSAVMEGLRPANEQSPDWIARQRDAIARTLRFMETHLGEKSYCMGTHFSLADIAVGVALGYLCLRFPDLDWVTDHPNLARLYEKLMQRQSFIDTVPVV